MKNGLLLFQEKFTPAQETYERASERITLARPYTPQVG
jgi:hypothetical protein